MSRIRTIKPQFWSSHQITRCSRDARLLFIGLWNFCDDHGIHPASLFLLKNEIFPTEKITLEEIKYYINELINNHLIKYYEVNDDSYWIVTGWKDHQKIDRPTYKYPLPIKKVLQFDDYRTLNSDDIFLKIPLYNGKIFEIKIDHIMQWQEFYPAINVKKIVRKIAVSSLLNKKYIDIKYIYNKIISGLTKETEILSKKYSSQNTDVTQEKIQDTITKKVRDIILVDVSAQKTKTS